MKALFFDLDGTLIDITRREIEVIYDAVSHFGMRVSKAKVKQAVVRTPSYLDVFKKLGFELDEEAMRYWTLAFVNGYQLSMARKGVKPTLRDLSKKYKLVCVTSRETLAEVIRELEFLHIDGLFNHVVTRDVAAEHFGSTSLPFFPFNEQRRKLYECALAIANCRPHEAVAIGDMGRELKPAKELGISTIGLVTHKARKNDLRNSSDILISRITQLQNALHGLDKPEI